MKGHDCGGNMVWDDDWCGCKVCGRSWKLDLNRGWQQLDANGNELRPRFVPKYKTKPKVKAKRTPSR